MDVSGVGAGPTLAEFTSALRSLAGPEGQLLAALEGVPQSGDTITATLGQLTELVVLRFLEIIERPPSPENALRLEGLRRASVSAAAEGNVQQALVKLEQIAKLDPRRAEALESDPGLASLRAEVRQLFFRLTSAAHLDAESRLGQATHLLEAAGPKESVGQEFRPEIAILIAGRLLEAGGYANCMCSAALSQMRINQYVVAPSPAPLSPADPKSTPAPSVRVRRQWMPRIRKLWVRAPLLVLLLAWLAIGLAAGSVSAILRRFWPQPWLESLMAGGVEVWGVGFLALIGFGFYARVRNWRR